MSAAKHTPGPWAVARYSAKRFGLGQAGSGAFFMLQCVNDNADDPQAKADARLIAAAPDLLAELRRCVALIEGEVPASAIAAIAKATGSQP